MKRKPMIAVIMDENTSAGGNYYQTSKNYFSAVSRAGGAPFGIPYLPELVDQTIEQFDGFLSVGGRIEFPRPWYVHGDQSRYPTSDRLSVELALMGGFLARNKPVLGICNGMQMLACLNGCRMVSDVHSSWPDALNHDQADLRHEVFIQPGTRMADIFGNETFSANTFHREAIVEASTDVVVTARAPDGVIEGVEIPSQSFAMGVQWHPEKLAAEDHAGLRIFDAFVDAAHVKS
ncbi:gamma-glutamyl-gamma-aminobutyrate hydrolase family protein [Aquamicrobium sp. LC103]|uniref:gamma-glutamyl-gamma-aminobutyrate hydrolase family protein n=1 Tax=Aquamicrobium sp. LC103 TaxID=1120658 RepID=UPI00063E7606|nr:gamma-glutamyl-gamma-aminobutyrate hydrolase family protein [Aquamicrobium sp. LC103]TKT79165.1 gamma-glutamyl-gamma-aminobutyrate hydrolase family protein [Aquamicrobium sp. LC103]